MWKRQKKRIILIFCCAVAVMTIGFSYSGFVAQQILKESTSHLWEIYSQVNVMFQSMVLRNWNLLDAWKGYIERARDFDSGEFEEFVEQQKEKWNFSEFYFIAEDGTCITAKGERGTIRFGENLSKLQVGRENVVLDAMLSSEDGEESITVFAVPTKKGAYQGVSYSAIGVSYDVTNMMKTLNVEAFSGKSESFVVFSNGNILISEKSKDNPSFNFLQYLSEEVTLKKKTAEDIQRDFKNGFSDIVRYRADGVNYYLIYQPIGIKDWMLLGIVPVSVVNANMNQIHWVTAAALAGIFTLVGFSIIVILVKRARKNVGDKILEIRYREQLFGMLSDTVDDIFIMLESDNLGVEYISPNVERLLGVSTAMVKENVWAIQATTVDHNKYFTKKDLDKIGLDQSMFRECEHVHQKSGERRWYQETAYHVNIQNTDKYILVLSDRTKEKNLNQHLKEALELAWNANEAKSHFLSNMSHDIRTPMNAIVGFATLLGKDAEHPDKVREYTRKITASSQHLLNLINDVLDMSKIESGKTSLNTAEFSVPEFMEEISAILMPQAKAKDQSFEMYVYGKVPEVILGDKLRLNQILINLLSNSIKYTQKEGHIELQIRKLEQFSAHHVRLQFVIWDNGMGMSEEYVKIIFEPFSREESARIEGIQGTGLGMAITKNLVDLMGGCISVESKLGEGSRFTVELEFSLPEENKEEGFFRECGIHRMLIVDDDVDICLEVKELMADYEVEVDYVTDGAQADASNYDIVLLDWEMPDINGVETARRICTLLKEKESSIQTKPVLVLTAYDVSEIEGEAKEAGIDAFMTKPFFVATFRQLLLDLRAKQLRQDKTVEEEKEEESSVMAGMLFLAAEDNELNAEILSEMLKLEGASCEIAANGQEAVDMFVKSEPGYYDMILMDVQMPLMNGYDATRAIRALERQDAADIPIIAMTANAFAEDVKHALEAGMTAHVAKPVDMAVLKGTLEKIKEQKQ